VHQAVARMTVFPEIKGEELVVAGKVRLRHVVTPKVRGNRSRTLTCPIGRTL
jgi:hypothetical protein